mmetsp:Transcript_23237/g.75276  ORF Transcript_23237/g.75276 Transcript_23237/m.75276 type:complete len:231 (-) Transcript_23237:2923-3615(-)
MSPAALPTTRARQAAIASAASPPGAVTASVPAGAASLVTGATSAGGATARQKARHSVRSGRWAGSSASSGVARASYRAIDAPPVRSAASRSSLVARSAFSSALPSSSAAAASLSPGCASAASPPAPAPAASAPLAVASAGAGLAPLVSSPAGGLTGCGGTSYTSGSLVAAGCASSSWTAPTSASPAASQLGSASVGRVTYSWRCPPRLSQTSSIGLAPPWPPTVAAPRPE